MGAGTVKTINYMDSSNFISKSLRQEHLKKISGLRYEDEEKKHFNQKIALGGPVESTSIFVLHTIDKVNKPDVRVTNEIGFSSNKQVIENILKGKFPSKFIVSFGYTGWGPNQLENEIAQNAWEITDAHQEILFDTPNNLKINKLSEVSGFDPRIINQTQGSS